LSIYKVNEAVFISDLHLDPNIPEISKRFDEFLAWAASQTRALYILGDFFHAWAGDDTSNAWSDAIADQLAKLHEQGVAVYLMCGNRDFLLGSAFARRASSVLLDEPAFIELGGIRVMLTHGDRYCTQDKAHQRFRRLTRNRWFSRLFLKLPRRIRQRMVAGVRAHSEHNPRKQPDIMDVVPAALMRDLKQHQINIMVHGHTHRPGLTSHEDDGQVYQHYVLSDWDAAPTILCYNESTGFCFKLFNGE